MHVAHKNEILIQKGEAIKKLTMPIFEKIDKYVVPPEKHKAVFDYTTEYFSKNKHMSHDRIARKVVEHFKLKLKGA